MRFNTVAPGPPLPVQAFVLSNKLASPTLSPAHLIRLISNAMEVCLNTGVVPRLSSPGWPAAGHFAAHEALVPRLPPGSRADPRQLCCTFITAGVLGAAASAMRQA